ncbi:hypothetical protein OAV01_05975, partial [Opitutales bacterium]|nr:hypothetical protein [Opitutales bacterium]
TVLFPVYFPSAIWEPQFLYGEMIFVRQNITQANREKIEGYLTHKWALADQLPNNHPYKGIDFTIDENGSLITAREFDYETDDHNNSVRIWATDEHNATTYNDFTVVLNNVVEDLDGDGTEDHYDDDIDGDGLSNEDEVAYNSDPRDANSSNRPPSDINASNLTIAENSAIGTVIGEFNATDPDGDLNPTFYASSIPIKAVTKQNNLIGWFKFDENNGTRARNSGLSDINGTLVGDASFTNGQAKFGGFALQVNPGGRVVLDDSIGGGSHTISVWFKELYSNSTSTWRVLTRGEDYHNYLMLNVNGSLGVLVENTGGSGSHPGWVYSSKILTPENTAGSWHHLVLTANGYDGKFYLDGEYVSSLTETSPSIGLYYIGNTNNGSQPFAKYIDDFRLYNCWLSGDEVSSIYGEANGDLKPIVSIDENGTLTSNTIFDYEFDDTNFTIRVGVSDDKNVTFEKDFLVTVSNVAEDLDGDGIEDLVDQDLDGDGVDNLTEYLNNSSPYFAWSLNTAPYEIFSTEPLTISENSNDGTFVADFNASDGENNQSITFSLFSEFPLNLSPKLWLDASDESTVLKESYRLDSGESNSTMTVAKWFNKSSTQYNAVPYSEEVSRRPHFLRDGFKNSFPCISFDGGNDLLVVEDSEGDFDAWSEISIFIVSVRHGLQYWVPHLSKGPKGESNTITGWEVIPRNFFNGAASWRVTGLEKNQEWHDMFNKSHWSPNLLTLNLGDGKQIAKLNGSVVGSRENSGTIDSAASFPVTIGGALDLNGSAYQHSPISFCEILIYNNSLNSDQIDKVESYLAHKWGMAINLPSTHSRLNPL